MEPQNKKTPTPLEKLQADKLCARIRCREAEQRLNENVLQIQNNSGKIILSGISTLLFPGTKTEKAEDDSATTGSLLPALAKTKPSFDDILNIGATILPHLWGIAKPVLITWGIGKAQSLLLGKLLRKNKKKK